MAEVLVIGKKISEMGLVNEITGEEKIPTSALGDKAVTTSQLLTYVNNKGVAQWGRIGGDITNQVDLQNQFTQERDTLKSYTHEQVSQQQVALQEHIDATNESFDYITKNGAALPYDDSIDYAEGAPVLKDGFIQYKTSDGFKSRDAVAIPTYNNVADGVDPVTGVAEGVYFNVRSISDDAVAVEYQNVGGVATPTGKSYPSSNAKWDASSVLYNSQNLNTVLDGQALVNENQSKRNMDAPTFKDYGAVGLNTLIPVSDLYTVGSAVYNPSKFKNLADVKLVYPDVTSATDSLDWAAIQKALKDRAGKDVQSRGGKFIINRKIVFNNPVHIIGDFENGPIYYTSEVTDAALSFEPTYKGARNAYLSQLHIRPQGDLATSTADAFRAVSNSTGGLNHLIIDKCDFRALGGGRAINLMNESSNINNDGTALIYIGRNTLLGGIRAPNLGDSCVIYWNNIKGKNIGIEGSLVNAGLGAASSLIIEKNNIVNDNGAIKLSNIRNTHILHNNIEQLVALNLADDRHTVELDGDIQSSYNTVMFNKIAPSDPNKYCGGIKLRNIDGGAVKFNQIGSSAVLDGSFNPVGRTDCIKLIGCKDLDIGQNKLYISSGCNGVYIETTSSNIKGVEDQSYRFFNAGDSTKTIDESTATLHVWRSIANANAIPVNANSTTLQAKLLNGVVHIRGNIKPSSGTGFTADMQIGQLPASMRPVQDTYLIQSWMNTGGTRNFCQIRIATDGSIRIPILLGDVAAVYISHCFAV